MRPIQAIVSSAALQHNLNVVKQHAQNAKIMAVIKANAYGHGLVSVAHALMEADAFATLNVSEAIDLREAGVTQEILLLEGVFDEEELRIAASFDISIVIHNNTQIMMLESAELAKPINIHLKINTGMNRLGFIPSAFSAAYKRLISSKNVANITLMTHFATADESTGIHLAHQKFLEATQGLKNSVSLANSATILRYPEAHGDWVRPGIMLYGATPIAKIPAADFGLKPAMQFTSEILAIQLLAKGESVGYGATFTAKKDMRIGVVACGYADGYPRHAPTGTPIAVKGIKTRTVGRVSMDMLFCDLTDIPEADVGSSVELWGNMVPVDAVAEASGTVGYELLCAVAPRVPLKAVE
ncbi:MAG TPA: alanine racemase [Methylophilaceae bacterium]|nr:alanine racemase [Methylophilaceae bacterium]